MKAYYLDKASGDQRLPPFDENSTPVDVNTLQTSGIEHRFIPVDNDGNWEQAINQIAKERSYTNRDVVNVSKAGLGDAYEPIINEFFEEHLHDDEEVRYILDGAGYFDVREATSDTWIRIRTEQGNYIKGMRLFKDEPDWTCHNRSTATDVRPYRKAYLESVGQIPVSD